MKKRAVFALLLCMVYFSMSACNAPDPLDQTIDPGSASIHSTASEPSQTTKPQPLSLAETVIYDEDNIRITATGIKDGFMGKEINFLVENNTAKNIAFTGDLFIVNGITVPGYVYIDVAAGKKSNDSLSFFSSDLLAAGIDQLGTVECKDASIVDTDSYDTLDDLSFVLSTSAAGQFEQKIADEGTLVYENAGIAVFSQVISHEIYGKSVRLLVRNRSEEDVTVQAENISVNGYTVDAWMYDKVYSNTIRFCELGLFSSGLEENGIELIETVTFHLKLIDADSFDTIHESEEIEIRVS